MQIRTTWPITPCSCCFLFRFNYCTQKSKDLCQFSPKELSHKSSCFSSFCSFSVLRISHLESDINICCKRDSKSADVPQKMTKIKKPLPFSQKNLKDEICNRAITIKDKPQIITSTRIPKSIQRDPLSKPCFYKPQVTATRFRSWKWGTLPYLAYKDTCC